MKRKLTERLPAKIGAFLLLMVLCLVLLLSAIGAAVMLDSRIYTRQEREVLYQELQSRAYQKMDQLCWDFYYGDMDSFERTYSENVSCSISSEENVPLFSNLPADAYENGRYFLYMEKMHEGTEGSYLVTLCVDTDFPAADDLSFVARCVHLAYKVRYAVFVVAAVAFLGAVCCFAFLLCAVGHRDGQIVGGAAERLPFDVVTALLAVPILAGFEMLAGGLIVLVGAAEILAAVLTLYFMLLALQIKTKRLISSLLIAKLLLLLKKGCSALFQLLGTLPQTAFGAVAFVALDIACLVMISFNSSGERFVLWMLFSVVGFFAAVYISLMVRRLYDATQAIAKGDLDYHVNTDWMRFHFLKAGNNLNHIAEGLQTAVEKGVRSERLKTELITNVSHDIKTPLTSIINYTDLISREETENERIKNYSTELLTQSQRLKKLIEDLIEASKASTGNIEVELEPCQVNVMLEQVAGEFQQRLADRGLTLVTRKPEESVCILADGRRLWRVFDNLLNNAAKYSQCGTRVYLALERRGDEAKITLKNVASYELNIPAEELMERFVRGDRSRSTEGNGLGLSIARSLTELQGGKLSLWVDADLFTVELRFPVIENGTDGVQGD